MVDHYVELKYKHLLVYLTNDWTEIINEKRF